MLFSVVKKEFGCNEVHATEETLPRVTLTFSLHPQRPLYILTLTPVKLDLSEGSGYPDDKARELLALLAAGDITIPTMHRAHCHVWHQ